MQKRVLEFIQEHQMIESGDRIVIGVSGGADSVCLLHILLEAQKKILFEIGVVHVNHLLRGEEARADQKFVEELCRKHRIEYKVFSFDVGSIARSQKMTVEEAGRMVRYQAFESFAKSWGGTKTALAHHQNDLAETMLHNLARGSGIAGLCSIHPVRNQYIRPLLCMNRGEVEQYLKERQLFWRTDSSNLDDSYMRNRIRHQVVEYLVQEVNPKAVGHMADTARDLYEARQFLSSTADERSKLYVQKEDGRILISARLTAEMPVIRKYILQECYYEIARTRKDLSREHIEMIDRLFTRQTGKQLNLPAGVCARRTYGAVVLECGKGTKKEEEDLNLPLKVPGQSSSGTICVQCSVLKRSEKIIPEKTYTKWLDYDRIIGNLVLRNRQSGDYITICASGGTKKLKDYFIDAKIPREERSRILLLADGSEILWIVGWRVSEKYKVTKDTEQVLLVQIKEGK